jgi:biofilm protein TabA
MIFAKLKDWRTIPGLFNHIVWEEAFKWIEANASGAELGIYSLTTPNSFVRVMEYDLKERGQARYESHLHTIDIQYTIQGGEGIEVLPVDELTPDGDYLKEKDFQHYKLVENSVALIENLKGYFCILFPQDGHMPQLRISGCEKVRKLVVKIPVAAVL